MKGRGRLFVKMVAENEKENITLNIPSHHNDIQPIKNTLEEDLPTFTAPPDQKLSTNSPVLVSNNSNDQLISKNRPNYYISPIRSDDSDIVDDSDADPSFETPAVERLPPRVVPCSSSSSSTNSSSSSSSSDSSSSSEAEEIDAENQATENKKRGRKRVRNPKMWKTKVVKLLRDSGQAYQSMSKTKKQIPERKLHPPCGDKCRLQCKNRIDETARQELFNANWSLADLQRQREFIVRHSQEIKPKYRYSSTQNFRALNTSFFFELNGTKIRVCKQFFRSTLDLNDRIIKTALSKKTETGVIIGELRGKHGNQPKISPEIKESVVNFINSIPRIESHYLRAQTSREYICSDKSLADLYRDYKEQREKDCLPFASQSTFNRMFNTEFNIGFYIPKKDQCDLCERFKNSADKEDIKIEYEQHLKEKVLAREEKERDKNRKDGTIVAVYDLQAVMQLPKGHVSLFFYKSRINCMNFTVSDLSVRDVTCYFWDETEGKRGATEIGSCILEYIQCISSKMPDKELDIIFYSDNCCGQQKNKYLLSIYAYAVNKMKVNSITHKFLIRGHSQNEGDNVHSVIEKQIKRHLKSGPIYTPQQYVTLIRTSKKSGNPYNVTEMSNDKFYDVKTLQESWGSNFNIDEDRCQVVWHDIKVLRVEKEHPQAFFYKTSFADEAYKKTNVRKSRQSARGAFNQSQIMSGELQRAYTEKIPLSAAKKKDIQSLIGKNAIPGQYYECYYKNILG